MSKKKEPIVITITMIIKLRGRQGREDSQSLHWEINCTGKDD